MQVFTKNYKMKAIPRNQLFYLLEYVLKKKKMYNGTDFENIEMYMKKTQNTAITFLGVF